MSCAGNPEPGTSLTRPGSGNSGLCSPRGSSNVAGRDLDPLLVPQTQFQVGFLGTRVQKSHGGIHELPSVDHDVGPGSRRRVWDRDVVKIVGRENKTADQSGSVAARHHGIADLQSTALDAVNFRLPPGGIAKLHCATCFIPSTDRHRVPLRRESPFGRNQTVAIGNLVAQIGYVDLQPNVDSGAGTTATWGKVRTGCSAACACRTSSNDQETKIKICLLRPDIVPPPKLRTTMMRSFFGWCEQISNRSTTLSRKIAKIYAEVLDELRCRMLV